LKFTNEPFKALFNSGILGSLSKANELANLPKSQLGEGAMTLWFQQTGSLPTRYAIEVTLAAAD
jgi:hypothetical protein